MVKHSDNNTITVYEYDTICTEGRCNGYIEPDRLKILQDFSGNDGVPYFKLINKGVRFCQYVGVLQVGRLTIEVLPKIDRGTENDKDEWRKILIDMLRKVGTFEVSLSSETDLKIKRNSILDIYIESFLVQVEKLVHQGLIKKYRKVEDNCNALKGKIVFAKHLSKNIIHKERFFVKYTVYDHFHVLNQLLFKTLLLIRQINTNQILSSKVNSLLLNFPELPDIKVSESVFDNIVYNRKSESYKQAMLISRLLLLNYHPDINKGKNHVLALMFDMNLLWERFVYVSLHKFFKGGTVEQQLSKPYWKLDGTRAITLRPDVILIKDKIKYVLDTKWKLPNNDKPSPGDLQQMYAYTKYFESDHTVLCFPGASDNFLNGRFFNEKQINKVYPCSVLRISFNPADKITAWQEKITTRIDEHLTNQPQHQLQSL
ncbi:MAG: hypothetical protein JWQ79_2510 [Mucilaginibacter sp.]|nr:hypothetical protein [Mucilaginibacter sp.]